MSATAPTHLLRAVRTSNDEHKRWARRAVESLVGTRDGLDGHVIGVWGLVYKQGTDTCDGRAQSSSAANSRGPGRVKATTRCARPSGRPRRHRHALPTPLEAAEGASAIVVETDWPSYRTIDPERLVAVMGPPIVVDANGFLSTTLGDLDEVRYVRVGGSHAADGVLAGGPRSSPEAATASGSRSHVRTSPPELGCLSARATRR